MWGKICSKPALGPKDLHDFVIYKRREQFLRCGSKSQKLLTSLAKNKVMRVLQPPSEQTACGLGTSPPPQKTFLVS